MTGEQGFVFQFLSAKSGLTFIPSIFGMDGGCSRRDTTPKPSASGR